MLDVWYAANAVACCWQTRRMESWRCTAAVGGAFEGWPARMQSCGQHRAATIGVTQMSPKEQSVLPSPGRESNHPRAGRFLLDQCRCERCLSGRQKRGGRCYPAPRSHPSKTRPRLQCSSRSANLIFLAALPGTSEGVAGWTSQANWWVSPSVTQTCVRPRARPRLRSDRGPRPAQPNS